MVTQNRPWALLPSTRMLKAVLPTCSPRIQHPRVCCTAFRPCILPWLPPPLQLPGPVLHILRHALWARDMTCDSRACFVLLATGTKWNTFRLGSTIATPPYDTVGLSWRCSDTCRTSVRIQYAVSRVDVRADSAVSSGHAELFTKSTHKFSGHQ